MITKQRLEELIKQGATIYGKIYGDILAIELSKKNKPEIKYDDRLDVYCTSNEWRNKMQFCYLWETKEDAEFALRYKRIPKTEYLDLLTWEEFIQSDKQIIFYNKDKTFYIDKVMNNTHIIIGYKCIVDLNEELEANRYNFYRKPATKENYLEVCEICRKLFLGEEVC